MKNIKVIILPFLILLSYIYGFIVFLKFFLYQKGLLNKIKFDKPIISIGNITTGGTGKTPMTIYLADNLKKIGKSPGIISRGYGRKSKGIKIVHDGMRVRNSVEISGDEPFLMATQLKNVPIIVSENRVEGIKKLIDDFHVDIIIMDDGFQQLKIEKSLDIVNISSNDLPCDYRLLPYGKLREPLSNIKRADLIVYTKTNNYQSPSINKYIKNFISSNPVCCVFEPILMKYSKENYHKTLSPNNSMFAFCGIAEPKSFEKFIKKLSLNIQAWRFFKDHQIYSTNIIKELDRQIMSNHTNSIITTEKDLVKLPTSFITKFNVYVIKLKVQFKSNEGIIQNIKPLL